jgi:hypothetical protein
MAFAQTGCMDLKDAAMPCPRCGEDVCEPLPGSTLTVAWYECGVCSHYWSVRIRNGRPVAEQEVPSEHAATQLTGRV